MELENFTEAEQNLIKIGKISGSKLRTCLGCQTASAKENLYEVRRKNPGDYHRYPILLKYAALYESVRQAEEETFDTIDYIALSLLYLHGSNYKKGAELGAKALKLLWPELDNPFFRIRTTPNILKLTIAHAYYELKQFNAALELYRQVPLTEFQSQSYMTLTCMYGINKNWNHSLELFKLFCDSYEERKNLPNELLFVLKEEETIIMDMLMQQKPKDFNQYGKKFYQSSKRVNPTS